MTATASPVRPKRVKHLTVSPSFRCSPAQLAAMHARADELGINLSNLIIEGLVAVGVELPPDGKRQRGPRRWRLTDPETQNAAANR